MRKIYYRVLIILYFLFLLIGCQARFAQNIVAQQENPTNTAVTVPTRTLTEAPPTPTTTITFIPSPSPSPSETSEPSRFQMDCYSLLPSFPQNVNPQGILILGNEPRYKFMDWESSNMTEIAPQKKYSKMVVSPDRKKVAYHDTLKNQIVVMTVNNQILRTIPWEKSWTHLSRWQNNEMLLLQTKEVLNSDRPNPPMVLAMLDTSTGQSRKMLPDYPDIAQAFTLWWQSGHTVYDPMLTRVVYAQLAGGKDNYALWDIAEKRELIALNADISEEPVWSPDGAMFIVSSVNGLSLVSRDGIILDNIYLQKTTYNGSDASNSVSHFTYSPDGGRIAFWVQVNGSIGKVGYFHLMFLDTITGKITDTCFEQEDYPRGGLAWSPDGDQLAAAVNYRPNDDSWDVIVADIKQKNAVKIAERLFPIGWLVNVP
jgi:hypothetical protein